MRGAVYRLLVVLLTAAMAAALGGGLRPGQAVAAGGPALSVQSDHWHVNATLSGAKTFVWVVKTTGLDDTYFTDMPSPWALDPLVYGGRTVRVGARASGVNTPWATEISFAVAVARPVVTVASDRRHVSAVLPNTGSFVFAVKADGIADRYYGYSTSPFQIDQSVYGGRSVRVSARAEGSPDTPWAAEQVVDVPALPAGAPVVSVKPDRRHAYAALAGATSFVFVVKSPGMDDWYSPDMAAPLVIDTEKYGGRSVVVSARASGPAGNPWAPSETVKVPATKFYGIVAVEGNDGTAIPEAKRVGITLDRVELKHGGMTVAQMDTLIAADTSRGITPVVLLSEYGVISRFAYDGADGWTAWAAMVVSRYGPGGSFWAGRSDARYAPTYFELLNEPYNINFYDPVEPAWYTTFFARVASAARAANPSARFLFAADPGPFQPPWEEGWDHAVQRSADYPAAIALANAVTVHPYNAYNSGDGWPRAATVHAAYPALPVWITEIGYRVDGAVSGVTITAGRQAAWLQRSLVDFVDWPWAQAYVWFKYQDYRDGSQKWGLVDTAGAHRPSYDAYRAFIS